MHSPKNRCSFPRRLLFSLLGLLATPVHGLDPHRAVSQYLGHHWTAEDGLPSASIEALAQDAIGYLWIRTAEGTVRFDGETFSPGDPPEALGRRGEPGTAGPSLRDRDGNLWVGSAEGLLRHTAGSAPGENPGDLLRLGEDSAAGAVTSLLEDREGSLWIGTDGGGLFRLNDGDFLLWGTREGLSSSVVRTVLHDAAGAFWIGTDGGGLNRLKDGAITRPAHPD